MLSGQSQSLQKESAGLAVGPVALIVKNFASKKKSVPRGTL